MKNKFLPLILGISAVGIIGLGIVGFKVVSRYTPTKERKDLSVYYDLTAEDQVAILLNNQKMQEQARLIDDGIYLPYSFIHEYLNQRLYWDSNEALLLYASDSQLFQAAPDEVYSDISEKPLVKLLEEEPYINIDMLQGRTDFLYSYYEDPSRLVLTTSWEPVEIANATKNTVIRTLGGIKSPIVKDITPDETLTVLARDVKWTKIVTEDGMIGFLRSNCISEGQSFTPVSEYQEEEHQHILLDEPVCMVWHQVFNTTANSDITKILDSMNGVNVISPTWFCLVDDEGNIQSNAAKEYVDTCHRYNVQVWPTINDVDFPEVDVDAVLSHTSTRTNLINQLIEAALECKCEGINVDLERTSESGSGTSYIEFIRELSIRCQEENLILSVDNTRPYSFNNYYDRTEQALYADYLVFMGYDEHYSGSEDGSVASLPWVEEGLTDTLAQNVPANQLILGNPFYTRVWKLTPTGTKSGDRLTDYEITSVIYSMDNAARLLDTKKVSTEWQSDLSQNYAEWEEADSLYEVWMEDVDSVDARMKLMEKYQLGGVAFWRSGLESENIWEVISPYMEAR